MPQGQRNRKHLGGNLSPNLLLENVCFPLNCAARCHRSSISLRVSPCARHCEGTQDSVRAAEPLLLQAALPWWVREQLQCAVMSPI